MFALAARTTSLINDFGVNGFVNGDFVSHRPTSNEPGSEAASAVSTPV
jgi:hypothetical protein